MRTGHGRGQRCGKMIISSNNDAGEAVAHRGGGWRLQCRRPSLLGNVTVCHQLNTFQQWHHQLRRHIPNQHTYKAMSLTPKYQKAIQPSDRARGVLWNNCCFAKLCFYLISGTFRKNRKFPPINHFQWKFSEEPIISTKPTLFLK